MFNVHSIMRLKSWFVKQKENPLATNETYITWAPFNWGVLNGVAIILGLHFCLLIPCIWIAKFMITLPTYDVRISLYTLSYVNNYLHDGLKTLKSMMVSKVCMYNAS
jgi:hypothetical protein